MEPRCWGDCPAESSFYYNNDREIGLILNRLLKDRPDSGEILSIGSESPAVSDGVLLHLAGVLSELRDRGLEVLWFAAYPGADYRDFGAALRRQLLQLWRTLDFKLVREAEVDVLSFEISGCRTPEDYFAINLAALAARTGRSNILLVLDLQYLNNRPARQRVLKLASAFLETPSVGWRAALAINGVTRDGLSMIQLRAPSQDLENFLSRARNSAPFTEDRPPHTQGFAKVARYIHPLVALNQPAQRHVFDYIINHAPTIDEETKQLLESGSLWNLANGRLRVSPSAIRLHEQHDAGPKYPQIFADTVPNGAKILSFQNLDQLLPQLSGLEEMESASSALTNVVDLFATAVGQKRSNNARYSDTLHHLSHLLESETKSLVAAGLRTTTSLLHYSSQLLLTHTDDFGASFFRLFEQMTFSYAEFIRLQYGSSDPRMYEASRWLTNLGYVHDKIKTLSTGVGSTFNRARTFQSAADYLSKLEPEDIRTWCEARYAEAWQLWDAGQARESIDKLISSGRRARRYAQRAPLSDEVLTIIVQELFVIAFTIAPAQPLAVDVREHLDHMLARYGSRLSLMKLSRSFSAGDLAVDAPPGHAALPDDVVVVSCYFDMHIALLAAQVLRRKFNRSTAVVLIPDRGTVDVRRYFTGRLNLLIGATDTPGPIGTFVTGSDAELVRLYALRSFEQFGTTVECSVDGANFHLLTSCGLVGNLSAWQCFLDRYSDQLKNEVSNMDELLRQLLIPPIVAAESKIVGAFIDRLLSRLTRKKDETKKALEELRLVRPEKVDEAITRLDGDVKAALIDVSDGASIAGALEEAMDLLSARQMDLNQLVGVASLAYDYAARLQKRFPPASDPARRITVYVAAFRDQRSQADMLRQEFLALPTSDYRRLNSAAETLIQSLRHFNALTSSLTKETS